MTQRNLKFLGAAAILALGVPALAGEITGNGKSTPIRSGVASSECAFSGFNDTPGEDGFGRTQSYGQVVALYGAIPNGTPMHPGLACRGR